MSSEEELRNNNIQSFILKWKENYTGGNDDVLVNAKRFGLTREDLMSYGLIVDEEDENTNSKEEEMKKFKELLETGDVANVVELAKFYNITREELESEGLIE